MTYNPAIVLAYFAACKLPRAVTEHRFDPDRKWRFDFAWPAARVALEVEGGVWTGGRHTRGKGFLADVEKYNRAAVLGWRVLRTTPRDLSTLATVHTLRAALRAEKPAAPENA
jgi:very-short-patch-repair endonuclease